MDCKAFFANIQKNFKPEAAVAVDAVYQFSIGGEGGGEWNASITGGTCTVAEGTADSPSCTVVTDANTWMDIVGKQISSMDAFMSGKLRIKGDMGLAMKLESMFLA
jgi:putative sterol carrier protein